MPFPGFTPFVEDVGCGGGDGLPVDGAYTDERARDEKLEVFPWCAA